MNAVASSSSAIGTPFKRRRTSSSDDNDCIKRPRYYYLLAPESTDEASSDEESVYSLQGHSTDLAKDTSDTSTESDSVVEFEVVSFSEGEKVYPLPGNDSCSSSPTDVIALDHIPDIFFTDTESCGGSSVVTMESGKDCRKRFYLFKNCVQCGLGNPLPFFRYCDKCFKVRKNFFPPRPKGKKKASRIKVGKAEVELGGDSGINIDLSPNFSLESSSQLEVDDPTLGKNLCNTCLLRPKNGGFFHKKIVHVFSCYECSIKIVKQTGRCPICKVRVMQVCKVVSY